MSNHTFFSPHAVVRHLSRRRGAAGWIVLTAVAACAATLSTARPPSEGARASNDLPFTPICCQGRTR
jgi:hypothetical protein